MSSRVSRTGHRKHYCFGIKNANGSREMCVFENQSGLPDFDCAKHVPVPQDKIYSIPLTQVLFGNLTFDDAAGQFVQPVVPEFSFMQFAELGQDGRRDVVHGADLAAQAAPLSVRSETGASTF